MSNEIILVLVIGSFFVLCLGLYSLAYYCFAHAWQVIAEGEIDHIETHPPTLPWIGYLIGLPHTSRGYALIHFTDGSSNLCVKPYPTNIKSGDRVIVQVNLLGEVRVEHF